MHFPLGKSLKSSSKWRLGVPLKFSNKTLYILLNYIKNPMKSYILNPIKSKFRLWTPNGQVPPGLCRPAPAWPVPSTSRPQGRPRSCGSRARAAPRPRAPLRPAAAWPFGPAALFGQRREKDGKSRRNDGNMMGYFMEYGKTHGGWWWFYGQIMANWGHFKGTII